MSQLEIQILHQDYLLTCPDGHEAQLMEAVERVDQQFQQMRDTSKLRSRERVGVLLAVNLAYENLELRNQLQALQQQVAAFQALGDSPPSYAAADADAARLQALENQAAADQLAIQHWAARIDQALLSAPAVETPSAGASPKPMAAQENDVVLEASAQEQQALSDTSADHVALTNLDTDLDVDLTRSTTETL